MEGEFGYGGNWWNGEQEISEEERQEQWELLQARLHIVFPVEVEYPRRDVNRKILIAICNAVQSQGIRILIDRINLLSFFHQNHPTLDDGGYFLEDLAGQIASIAEEYIC